MKKFLLFLSIALLAIASCKKPDFLGNNPTGEALGPLSLVSPSNSDTITLNVITPSKTVVFTWTAAVPGVETKPTYKWVAALQTGNIDLPLVSLPSDNGGTGTTITFTQQQVDSLLGAKGFGVGAQANLIWSVIATNGDSTVLASSSNTISITRFQTNGLTPFVLLGPVSSTTSINISPDSTADSLKFNWTRAISVPATFAVQYRVYFYNQGFTVPLFSVSANHLGSDSLFTIAQSDFADSLVAHGITNLTQAVSLTWTVAATAGNVTEWSSYTNQLSIIHTVPPATLFLVGGDTPVGWGAPDNSPPNCLQFLQDNSTTGVYYIYVYLTTGNGGFKFLSLNADWNAPGQNNYGDAASSTTGNDPSQNTGTLANSGGSQNIATPNGAGVYRIQVDLTTMKYNIVKQGVGIVGAIQGWDNTNPIFMNYLGVNNFIVLQNFTTGNEQFKFNDGINVAPNWPSGYGYTNYWGVPSGAAYNPDQTTKRALLVIAGGDNVFLNDNPEPTAGLWRVIWDGTNATTGPTYQVTYANTMRITGAVIASNPWSPGNSPQMTYQGNGVWQATNVALVPGEFKFVSADAFPSGFDKYYLDYGNNGVSNSTGTAGGVTSVNQQGDGNLSFTGAAGNYTVTLDEYHQTYTIQ
jgi:hypothetical protein